MPCFIAREQCKSRRRVANKHLSPVLRIVLLRNRAGRGRRPECGSPENSLLFIGDPGASFETMMARQHRRCATVGGADAMLREPIDGGPCPTISKCWATVLPPCSRSRYIGAMGWRSSG